jgi:hypothetical protein
MSAKAPRFLERRMIQAMASEEIVIIHIMWKIRVKAEHSPSDFTSIRNMLNIQYTPIITKRAIDMP